VIRPVSAAAGPPGASFALSAAIMPGEMSVATTSTPRLARWHASMPVRSPARSPGRPARSRVQGGQAPPARPAGQRIDRLVGVEQRGARLNARCAL